MADRPDSSSTTEDERPLRTAILAAAREILVTDGPAALSMRQVAKAVDRSATSIYLHFPSKDALVHALIDEGFAHLHDQLQSAADGEAQPQARLEALCRRYVAFGMELPEYYQVMFSVPVDTVARYPAESYRRARANLDLFASALGELEAAGACEPLGDPWLAASVLWSALHGAVSLASSRRLDTRHEREVFLERAVEQALRGCCGRVVATSAPVTAAPAVAEAEPEHDIEGFLGRCVPDLLDEACDRHPNDTALNQPTEDGWLRLSNTDFRERARAFASGLLGQGLHHGDRVALYTESDLTFVLADMACLTAGLVDVPLYLSNSPENNAYVTHHSGARAMVVGTHEQLDEVATFVGNTPALELVLVMQDGEPPAPPKGWPEGLAIRCGAEVESLGRRRLANPETVQVLSDVVSPQDLATIVYTSGTTGTPKGVLLTHENLSFNALASFACGESVGYGDEETTLNFLPLSHAFGRAIWYGFVSRGHSTYFSSPLRLSDDLKSVKPTIFATVPRVLERIHEKICLAGSQLKPIQRGLFDWAMTLARQHDPERPPAALDAVQHQLADRLVWSKWRAAAGGRLRWVACGGAALSANLVRIFTASGIPVCQGYGLSEASPIVSTNRVSRNRAGTVGPAIPGVEVLIAEDGEILTRGPHVMKGYYLDDEATAEVIDEDGWLHTGDIGQLDEQGFLRVTDRKKNVFKLSTGKYVSPAPLEARLGSDSIVEHAVVLGAEQKFCAALVFPSREALEQLAQELELGEIEYSELLQHPVIHERYQELVDAANLALPEWETIKRFRLVDGELTVENGLLTPTLKVRRARVRAAFPDDLAAVHSDDEPVTTRSPS
ncbi:MAG: AMP-binding protein [Acidobacteriota bacterium]